MPPRPRSGRASRLVFAEAKRAPILGGRSGRCGVTEICKRRYNIKMAKISLSAVVIIGIAILLFVYEPGSSFLPNAEGKTWVEIDPIQCGGNPWEIWQSEQGVAYDMSESDIIKLYYREKENIEISEVKSKQTHEAVCLACNCPTGDTLYLLVDDLSVQKMLTLGYSLSD